LSGRSLKLRLFAGAAISIAVALIIAGLGLLVLFERHVSRRVDAELETYLRQLAGNVTFGADGSVTLARQPADPRFNIPLSGLYWEIRDEAGQTILRSRSLWDEILDLPTDELASGNVHRHVRPGPADVMLIVRERQVTYDTDAGPRHLRIAVGVDDDAVTDATRAFAAELAISLALLGLVLLAAAWAQIHFGLKPLETVRRAIGAVRSGVAARLPSDYPAEVVPLVQEVNDLLDAQDVAIERARARAADLAHGLKTPLTVLATRAERVRKNGDKETADELEEIAGTMRRHVERAIAVARLSHRPAARIAVEPIVRRVAGALAKTPAGERIAWTVEVPADIRIAVDAEDLYEALGNLVDNAVKWANGTVAVSARQTQTATDLVVEDDGPGIPAEDREKVMRRWERLDTATSGSGLGLAIVAEIAKAYGGDLTLDDAPAGGTRATLRFPGS
jgi:signal transduction histidine kinase